MQEDYDLLPFSFNKEGQERRLGLNPRRDGQTLKS
jgi:hypothetical protein